MARALSDASWYDPAAGYPAPLRPRPELAAAAAWCREDADDHPGPYTLGKVDALAWLLGESPTAPATGRQYPPQDGPVGWELSHASEYAAGWCDGQRIAPDPQDKERMIGIEEVLYWADTSQDDHEVPWLRGEGRPAFVHDPVVPDAA